MELAANIERWTRWNAGILLLSSAMALIWAKAELLVAGSAISVCLYFYWNRTEWKELGWLGGSANWVTLFRWLGLLVLMVLGKELNLWIITGWALAVLCLDGLDGYLARKYDSSSIFGEYLDKETDAFFMLGMSFLIWQMGLAGIWVLILGWLRYIYVLALIRWKPGGTKEVRSSLGRVIAVVLMIGVALVFILPQILQFYELLLLLGLVLFSFGRSFVSLVRR